MPRWPVSSPSSRNRMANRGWMTTKVLSGIIFINRNGLRWRDAPAEYGPHKTLYNRWKRWSDKGIFLRILAELAKPGEDTDIVAIDGEGPCAMRPSVAPTHLKAHRTAASLWLKKGGRPPDWPDQRRAQHETARGHRPSGASDTAVADGWAGVGLHRSAPASGRAASRETHAGGSRL